MKRGLIRILLILLCLALLAGCTKAPKTWQEFYDLGVRYLDDGKYEQAIIAFTAAITIDGTRPEAYAGRADAYTAVGNESAAQEDYRLVLELAPDFDWTPYIHITPPPQPEPDPKPPVDDQPEPPVDDQPEPPVDDQPEPGTTSLAGTYWLLSLGVTNGSSYQLRFLDDNTCETVSMAGEIEQYRYSLQNGTLTLDGITYTYDGLGYTSEDTFYNEMAMEDIHYTLYPSDEAMWLALAGQ